MHSLPPLISDLALILIVAGLVTVLFKRLKQPLVLGYIVAGFLAGPHMPYMPTVQDHSSIETWSSIGVIFLMFSLGLEFSIKKIAAMGMRPILAAAMVMGCMIGVGGATGRLFDWSSTDSLFLGGMLAMSSTTIIYKAFDDLGLRRKRFAGEVLSVLILEDILGILLMVILSATAVSQQFEGGELVKSLLSLGFFLVLWFVVGIYVVPAFLRRARAFINDETLLVVSIGLCFVLVVLADRAGYSSAFGAFIMGSILSETLEAEKIEHLVSPVKDLFGAIFFVSVGMMVDPGILVAHWGAVLVITLAVLGGQMVFGTLSFVVAGHPLRRAMNCGFSLAQIGEFAFIIAALGVSLKVTSPYLYPIVVAVSIITTFLTPYMIRLADPAYGLLSRRFGHWFKRIDADRVATERATATSGTPASSPQERRLTSYAGEYMKATVLQTLVYGVLIFATVVLSFSALLPVLRSLLTHWVGNAVTGLLTLWFVSVFVRPVVMRKHNSSSARALRTHFSGRLLVGISMGVRLLLAVYTLFYIIEYLSPFAWYYHLAAALLLLLFILRSRRIKYQSIRIERRFRQNLSQRETASRQNTPGSYAGRLAAHDMHLARLTLPTFTHWAGQTLQSLDLGRRCGVHVAAVLRGDRRINIPDGSTHLYPGDVLEVIGDDSCLENFAAQMQSATDAAPAADHADHSLRLLRLRVSRRSPLVGTTVAESGIRDTYDCMLIGFEDAAGNIEVSEASRTIVSGQVLWVVGERPALRRLEALVQPPKSTAPQAPPTDASTTPR